MKTFPAAFLNVDLDVKSRDDLTALADEWNTRVAPMHAMRLGRRYWRRFGLWKPISPSRAIQCYATLVRQLSPRSRRLWAASVKEFDIGIQAGFERGAGEWVLDAKVVRAAADLGAGIRLTVYSPLLVIDHEEKAARGQAGRGTRRRTRA